jgi:hypothetical protein
LDYDDYQVASAPPELRGENGTLWNRTLGIVKDAIATATRAAVMQRFADFATPSTLVALLEDRNLDPAWREDETSVRARVKAAWETWGLAGTPAGMGRGLQLAGYVDYEIVEQPGDPTLQWFEFYVIVRPPFPWVPTYLDDGRWDEPGVWDDGGSWAPDLPPEDLSRLRLVVRKWKPLHARCTHIRVVHGGETWDATAPPGTWDDDATATWGDDVSYLAP